MPRIPTRRRFWRRHLQENPGQKFRLFSWENRPARWIRRQAVFFTPDALLLRNAAAMSGRFSVSWAAGMPLPAIWPKPCCNGSRCFEESIQAFARIDVMRRSLSTIVLLCVALALAGCMKKVIIFPPGEPGSRPTAPAVQQPVAGVYILLRPEPVFVLRNIQR